MAALPELRALLSSTGSFRGHLEVTTGASGAKATSLRPQPSRQKLFPVAGQQTFCLNGSEVDQMLIGFFFPLLLCSCRSRTLCSPVSNGKIPLFGLFLALSSVKFILFILYFIYFILNLVLRKMGKVS